MFSSFCNIDNDNDDDTINMTITMTMTMTITMTMTMTMTRMMTMMMMMMTTTWPDVCFGTQCFYFVLLHLACKLRLVLCLVIKLAYIYRRDVFLNVNHWKCEQNTGICGVHRRFSEGYFLSQATDLLKHGASLYLKFEGLNLSVVIIFKTFHWLKNFQSCSVVSVARCQCCFASEKWIYVEQVRRPF